MKLNQLILMLFLGILSFTLVIGCQPAETSNQITISASATFQDVMETIKPLYQEKYPEKEITYNFGASGSLQRQIEQGAPVDVFMVADAEKMDSLEEQGLIISETRQDILKNKIALVTASDNNLELTNFNDITQESINLVGLGEAKTVAAGRYTQEILDSLNIADEVYAKAVYGKDVRQIVNYVATGNVEVGIVFQTDAKNTNNIKTITTAPKESHSPIICPIAVIKDSQNTETGKEFIEFLTSNQAQAVFENYGFIPINSNQLSVTERTND